MQNRNNNPYKYNPYSFSVFLTKQDSLPIVEAKKVPVASESKNKKAIIGIANIKGIEIITIDKEEQPGLPLTYRS